MCIKNLTKDEVEQYQEIIEESGLDYNSIEYALTILPQQSKVISGIALQKLLKYIKKTRVDELLNCPFCGNKPQINISKNVWCENPKCEIYNTMFHIKIWNFNRVEVFKIGFEKL